MSREVGRTKWNIVFVNGCLFMFALVSLAPLLWMVSASLMPAGEASRFPPPFFLLW